MSSRDHQFRYKVGDLVHDNHLNVDYLVLYAGWGQMPYSIYGESNHYIFLELQSGRKHPMLVEWIEPERHSRLIE